MYRTFNMELEIRDANEQYVNPLVRCDICMHRICRCHDEQQPISRRSDRDDDVASDNRSRAEDIRRAK